MDITEVRWLRAAQHPGRLLRMSAHHRSIAAGFGPLLVLYALYTLLRWTFVERASIVGDHNAHTVMHLEQRLGINWELWIQSHALSWSQSTWLVNHYYVYAFFPVLIAAAALAVLRSPGAFYEWRTIFVVSLAFALVGFALYPLTPPRLLDNSYGFVDSLMVTGPRYYGDESGSSLFNLYGSIPSLVNEYAAMPSMHVGWSAVAAALLIAAFPRSRAVKIVAVAHVAMMQLSVVATGNHYLIDGIVGLMVVALSWVVVMHGLPRANAWWAASGQTRNDLPICQE
jgi:hypothetical protein